MRVLVVEDETELRESLVEQLRDTGFAVDAAPDGEEGLYFVLSPSSGTVTFYNDNDVAYSVVEVGPGLKEVAKDEARNRLYVTGEEDGVLYFIDAVLEKVTRRLRVGDGPYGVIAVETFE